MYCPKHSLSFSQSQVRISNGLLRLVLLAISVALLGVICYAQEPDPPNIDLLKLNGSKPNLAANGEGIISFKTSDLYKRGVTRVRPFDLDLKIELPTGYTLFNNLAYVIESDVVCSGPNDVVFSIPSATRKELFDRLRILYAEYDQAEPAKPRWVDGTVIPGSADYHLSKAEYEKRHPDFDKHTIHAFMEDEPVIMVVAIKDSAVARDNFQADLSVSVTATPETVMEGRPIKQVFVVTNKGPDTASAITFSSYVEPDFVALTQSQGVCRWDAHNIYCNLGTLQKGASATITYEGKCGWVFYDEDDKPRKSGGQDATPLVRAAEIDPDFENNHVFLDTPVIKDPNKAPIVEIVSPTQDQFFVGPQASVKAIINAHDPDGTIAKVELFDQGEPIGTAELVSKDRYEFTYENVPYGHRWLVAIVTDNKGRPTRAGHVNFHVNGQARIKIVSPTANQVINGPVEGLTVTFRVKDPAKAIKQVVIHLGLILGGLPQPAIPGPGADEYSTTFKDLSAGGKYAVYAVATDAADVTTLSEPVYFRITEPPHVSLYYFDGEYARDIADGIVLSSSAPIELITKVSHYQTDGPGINKVEFYVDGQLLCRDVNNDRKESSFFDYRDFQCHWKAKPGKYVLTAVATDSDGAVGKSTPVEVVVR